MPLFTQLVSDNFQRPNENPLSGGGVWLQADNLGTCQVIGNFCEPGFVNNNTVAYYNGGVSFTSDHYSEITVHALLDSQCFAAAYVRQSASADTCYGTVVGGPLGPTASFYVVRRIGSVQTILNSTTTTVNSGDKIKCSIQGNTLTAYLNGALIFTITDANITTGFPGIHLQVPLGDVFANSQISSFTAGTASIVNGESLNLGQIRSQVEQYLMNTSTDVNSLSWSIAEINSYINQGIFYTQQVTEWFEEFDNIVLSSGVSTYTGPSRAYRYYRVTWDRVFLPQTNEYELDRDDPSWRAAPPNNPFRFYFPQMNQNYTFAPYPTPSQNGYNYAPFSQETGVVCNFLNADGLTADTSYTFNQELGVVIGVADTNGAIIIFEADDISNPFTTVSPELGELQIYNTDELNLGLAFKCIPDLLVLDTDTPQLPIQCHLGIVFYALMKCFVREGEFQDLQLAAQWFAAYADWMESVLENKARWWPTRVKTMEPFEEGSLFAKALNAIGFPLQLDLKPSYGS